MRVAAPLLLPIFRSANQARLLSAIFLSGQEATIQQLSKKLAVPYPTVHREVGQLLNAGLVSEERVGNARVLAPNQQSPFFRPLRDLLAVAFGPTARLQTAMAETGGVIAAAIFGSWAERTLGGEGPAPQDIDLLVVGNPHIGEIYAACSQITSEMGWAVNPTVLSAEEWAQKTPFLEQVRAGPLVQVVGTLPEVGKP